MNRYDFLLEKIKETSETIFDLCEVFGSDYYLVSQYLNIENNLYNEIKKFDKIYFYSRKNQDQLNSYGIKSFTNW